MQVHYQHKALRRFNSLVVKYLQLDLDFRFSRKLKNVLFTEFYIT